MRWPPASEGREVTAMRGSPRREGAGVRGGGAGRVGGPGAGPQAIARREGVRGADEPPVHVVVAVLLDEAVVGEGVEVVAGAQLGVGLADQAGATVRADRDDAG